MEDIILRIIVAWAILYVPIFWYGFHEIDKEFKDKKDYNYRFLFLVIWGVVMLILVLIYHI